MGKQQVMHASILPLGKLQMVLLSPHRNIRRSMLFCGDSGGEIMNDGKWVRGTVTMAKKTKKKTVTETSRQALPKSHQTL